MGCRVRHPILNTNKMKKIILFITVLTVIAGCKKDKIDNTPPEIDESFISFPLQCDEIKRGETFIFKAKFTDDFELGSFGLDVHNNFDHHNHSTETGVCASDTIKTPVNPYVLLKNYEIPSGLKSYEANINIAIPTDIDKGDYHFMIKVTDKAGWQVLKGLSVKIVP